MGEDDLAARATGNLGGCRFALHQYRPALDSFLEAHRLADRAGDASYAAILDAGIASLYSEMGGLEAAPTPDEDGPLFGALYRNLRTARRVDPGLALRTAQLEMMRSGDRRAQPRYWGAYFVIGGE